MTSGCTDRGRRAVRSWSDMWVSPQAYSTHIIASIHSLNDLDLLRVVVKIVMKNSSHGPGCYSKSGCVSHGRPARTSIKRLSNPFNILWSSYSSLTATSFFLDVDPLTSKLSIHVFIAWLDGTGLCIARACYLTISTPHQVTTKIWRFLHSLVLLRSATQRIRM